jgi:hypothetical protein
VDVLARAAKEKLPQRTSHEAEDSDDESDADRRMEEWENWKGARDRN